MVKVLKQSFDAKNLLLCILGSFIYCVGFTYFIKSANLYSGGFLGIAQLISLLLPGIKLGNSIDIQGILYFCMNIPLLIIGLKKLGIKFMTSSIICVIAESIMLALLPVPASPILNDTLANCVIGGCIEGIGTAISFNAFASGGGTDILSILICKKFKNLKTGQIALGINLIVYVISGIIFSLPVAIFSLIASFVASFTTDKLHKQNNSVVVNIMACNEAAVKEYILKTLDRDATEITGTGVYSGKEKHMIISVMSEYELSRLQHDIKNIDDKAFVFVQPSATIIGQFEKRFSKK